MKRLLLIVLFISFGYSQSINDEKLIKKGRKKYHPDTNELYSGKVFKNRMGGEKDFEGSYKDGKKDGLWTVWYENGQKKEEGTYKDGKEISSKRWNKDGSVYDLTLSDEMRDAILQLVLDIKPHIPESAYDEIMEYIESGKVNKKNYKRHYSKWSKIKKKHSNKK
mgnify:CR=1 FL=1